MIGSLLPFQSVFFYVYFDFIESVGFEVGELEVEARKQASSFWAANLLVHKK